MYLGRVTLEHVLECRSSAVLAPVVEDDGAEFLCDVMQRDIESARQDSLCRRCKIVIIPVNCSMGLSESAYFPSYPRS